MIDIQRTETPEVAVAQSISDYIRARGHQPTLVLVAGGSLPETVLPHVDRSVLGPHLTIGIFDERCTEDEAGLNELQLQATPFYTEATSLGVQTMDVVVGDQSTCATVAEDWEDRLRTWRAQHPEGVIVVLAGVGADGHVAGILVHTKEEHAVFTGREWIVAHHFLATENQYPHRITPTFTFWREAVAASFIYMSGTKKQDALDAIVARDGDLCTTPGHILNSLNNVQLYVS